MGKFYTLLAGFTVCASLLAACVTTEPVVDTSSTPDEQRKARVDSALQVKGPTTIKSSLITKQDTTKAKTPQSARRQ
jgi:hypothetical protein